MSCVRAWTTPWNPPPTNSPRRARIVAELAPLMPPTQTERDARWLRAAGQAKALAWFSLAWMTGEGVLGLIAGITANSISLIGWALGSVIEGLASIIVIWRFTGQQLLMPFKTAWGWAAGLLETAGYSSTGGTRSLSLD